MSPSARLITSLQSLSRPFALPPAFLLPSLYVQHSSPFSSTSTNGQRRDRNKNRGVSALRRTGLRPRQILSVSAADLPRPVLDSSKRSAIQVDEDHGLWQFFNRERTPIATPEADNAHGRAWSVQELRQKNWEDLHRLWWTCVKERNRLSTEAFERARVNAGYGKWEAEDRDKEVKGTMKAIKHTLTERWYAWEAARKVAEHDPEVDLFVDSESTDQAYKPIRQPPPVLKKKSRTEAGNVPNGQIEGAQDASQISLQPDGAPKIEGAQDASQISLQPDGAPKSDAPEISLQPEGPPKSDARP